MQKMISNCDTKANTMSQQRYLSIMCQNEAFVLGKIEWSNFI